MKPSVALLGSVLGAALFAGVLFVTSTASGDVSASAAPLAACPGSGGADGGNPTVACPGSGGADGGNPTAR